MSKEKKLANILRRKLRLLLRKNFPSLAEELNDVTFPEDFARTLRTFCGTEKAFETFCQENKIDWRELWDQAESELFEEEEEKRTKSTIEEWAKKHSQEGQTK